jgi:hypothetical protein
MALKTTVLFILSVLVVSAQSFADEIKGTSNGGPDEPASVAEPSGDESVRKIYTSGDNCSSPEFKGRDYFQKAIQALPSAQRSVLELTPTDFQNPIVPFECIQKAQRNFFIDPEKKKVLNKETGKYYWTKTAYRYCDAKVSMVEKRRPCVSTSYTAVLYNSFNGVMDCFGIPPKELFALINQESGFHINAMSPYSCSGLGQLSQGAVDTLNKPENWERYGRDVVNSSKSQFCEPVKYVLERPHVQMKLTGSDRCQAISLPKNPDLNLIYTAMNYKLNHEKISARVDELRDYLPKDFTETDIERLKIQLTQLAHNAGINGIKGYFRSYVTHNKMTREKLDLTKRKTGFNLFLAKYYSGDREQVSTYIPSMSEHVAQLETQSGKGSCQDLKTAY